MTKVRIGLINRITGWTRRSGLNRTALFLVYIGTACALIPVGCSMNGDKPPAPEAGPKPEPLTQSPGASLNKPGGISQALSLQELSVHEERGQTTLLLKFSQPVTQYRHFQLPQPARIVLDIFGEVNPRSQTETFRVETNWVSTLRLSSTDGDLRLAMDVAAATVPAYTIAPDNGGLKIVIGTLDPNATGKKDVTLVRNGQRLDVRGSEAGSNATREPKTSTSEAADALSTEKKYTGQKISLDFKDADIKNVFRLLAEVSGLNIIVTNDVNKKVTVRLVEVPWDQALDLIIDTNGLAKEQIGNVLRISTAATMKAENDALIAAKKAKDDLEPLQTVYFNINYATAKDFEPNIKKLLSNRGTFVTDNRSNTVMVRDIQQSIDDVTRLIAKLDTRTPQVLIESNLIETTPSFARTLGTEIDAAFNNNRVVASSRFLAGNPFSGTPNTTVPPFPVPTTGFKFGYLPANMNAFLTAAENEGNVKIISRPSVVTLNNQPSTIKSQRILRIALPSSTNIASGSGAAAGTAVATQEVPVGIQLTVTPQVSSDGFILMNIKVESSSVANNPTVSTGTAGVIPFDTLTRNAEAHVLVRDGETIVIGGILKDTAQEATSGVPYLKDIPVIGWLFKNWTVQKDLEELVVFITPRLASAGSENLPTADQLWRDKMKQTQGDQPLPLSPTP
jgi:type IV pilus assembly protein PilQ